VSRREAAAPPEIPGLRFIEVLGVGGFADVYRFEQLGRTVAVKVLTADLTHNSQQAFEAEANQMARLSNHPSIVSIYHAGAAPDGRSYLVMEVCQPQTLESRIKARPLTVAKALEITIQIAGAVESAHRMGVLHRDIKPANILFTEFGRAALTDFGISVSTQDGQQGVGVGVSPAWAPPEQVTKGQPMVPASDVYSLAATCWAMLGGRSPMIVPGGDNSNLALMARARNEPVPPLRREDVPEQLERVLVTAMAKRADQRFASALELGRALQAIQVALHLPMTPIEVGEDSQDDLVADDQGSEEVGSTRISTFKVIDPDGAPAVPAPGPATPAPAPPAPAPPAYAPPVTASAPRDFTGPAIPVPVEDATVLGHQPAPAVAPDSPPDDRAEPPPPAARTARTAVLAGLGVVLVGAVVAWQLLGGSATEGTTQDVEPTGSSRPADAVGDAVPSPRGVVLVRRGDEVVVRWRNPAPEDGDSFLYRVADPSRQRPLEGPVESGPVTVPAEQGRTCVEVMLRRTNGQTSAGATECTR
jgi:serine/threonine protein kinase